MSFTEPEIYISHRHLSESGPPFSKYTTINIREGVVLKTITTNKLVLVEKLKPRGAIIRFVNGSSYYLEMWKLKHMMYENGVQSREKFDSSVKAFKQQKELQKQQRITAPGRSYRYEKKPKESVPRLPKASTKAKKIRIKNQNNPLYGKTGFFVYYNEYQCHAVVSIDGKNVNVALCEIEYIK